MRILILTNNDVGLYKFRVEVIQALLREHEVHISLPDGEFIPEFQRMGCRYVKTEFNRRGMNPIADISLLLRYVKIIRTVRPDVILTYTVKPNVYGGIAAKLMRVPFIANVTGLGTTIENGGPMRTFSLYLYRLGLWKARCVFFQNRYNHGLFVSKRVVSGRTRLIPGSGVNISRFTLESYPDEGEGLRFLFIGRIMRDKGIEELLTAAEAVKSRHPKVTFTLIGDCDEDYGDIFREKEARGVIRWLGSQKDVRPFIAESHCTVLPSYHEGTANVLLESAAMGRPVISTRVPGCRETFEEGVTGLGCEVRDTESLVSAIEAFIAMPHEKKAAMGLAARKKMENEFSREIVIKAYMEEINAVFSKRGGIDEPV